jgi:hypothetical protein
LNGRGYQSGRRDRFGDGDTDLAPDKRIVGIVGEGCFQERFDVVEVEVVGKDRGTESQKVVVKILSIVVRTQKMRDREGSECCEKKDGVISDS